MEVILGGTPNARYPITATCTDTKCKKNPTTNEFISATITHNTEPFGNCTGNWFPQNLLVLKTVELVDAKGNPINAGKVMTDMPLMARIYFIREGETEKPWTYTCEGHTVNCDLRVGDRSYTIDTAFDNTATSVTFAGQAGTSQGNGIYAGTYTLPALPGAYTVSINATAKAAVDSWSLYIGCTECSYPPAPLTGSLATTKQVYGVDLTLDPVPTIFVDANGYTQRDHVISYTITPVQYQAMNAYVKVYKFQPPSLEPQLVFSIPTERQNRGSATLARGMQFDKNSTYQVEVVLNDGAGTTEMRSAKVNLTVTDIWVWITDVSTPCDNLVTQNPCVDSFVAKNDLSGDVIDLTGKAMQGATDMSSQITWTCVGTHGETVDGVCESSANTGSTFTFVPHPPAAVTGRTTPLSYQISARITVNNVQYEELKLIEQDNIDQLRQQYYDLNYSYYEGAPVRQYLSSTLGNAVWPNSQLEDSTTPGNFGWFQNTILTVITNLRNDYGHQMTCVSSGGTGYRSPFRNSQVSTADPPESSYHPYGRAADIHFSDVNNNGSAQDEADSIENTLVGYKNSDAKIDWYFGRIDGAIPGTGWVHVEYEY